MKHQKRWMVSANGLYVTDLFWSDEDEDFSGIESMKIEMIPEKSEGIRMTKKHANIMRIMMMMHGYSDVKLIYR